MRESIPMNDLGMQYARYQNEIDAAIADVIQSSVFIGGPKVRMFEQNLSGYLGSPHVIGCANGTDALQIALMALNMSPGDEVITTSFTFAATVETICLSGLKPRFVDINPYTFCIDTNKIEAAITDRTRCILPVHLFGQCADMESIVQIAKKYNLYIIEDNAQALGANFTFSDGRREKAGTIGHIGTTSFFPSKNLGAFGDGGALFTNDAILAQTIRMLCNHGSQKKYYHEIIGVNSRLDAIQAAILDVKLKHLTQDLESRKAVAAQYDAFLSDNSNIQLPSRSSNTDHTFHQYTIRIKEDREAIVDRLKANNISTSVYYPLSLHVQKAFSLDGEEIPILPETELACKEVLSLPIFPDMTSDQIKRICQLL